MASVPRTRTITRSCSPADHRDQMHLIAIREGRIPMSQLAVDQDHQPNIFGQVETRNGFANGAGVFDAGDGFGETFERSANAKGDGHEAKAKVEVEIEIEVGGKYSMN